MVQRLVADTAPGAAPAAERKEVTALFADLVGYTALNGYFQRMSDAISWVTASSPISGRFGRTRGSATMPTAARAWPD